MYKLHWLKVSFGKNLNKSFDQPNTIKYYSVIKKEQKKELNNITFSNINGPMDYRSK